MKKIDYVRNRIEQMKSSLSDDEHNFLVASLLVSADNVGNVAAVYGCYLKNFKKVALRPLVIAPVHTYGTSPSDANRTENIDVLSDKLKEIEHLDVAYIDPPYNERQYPKLLSVEPDSEVAERTRVRTTAYRENRYTYRLFRVAVLFQADCTGSI